MNRFRSTFLALLCSALATTACERAKSANPLSPDVAGPIPGVSITAPKPLEPAQGTQVVKNGPMTLLIENASTSGQRAVYLQVQVATDDNFAQLVHQAERIEPGPNGRTSYRLPAELGSGQTYFWRSRAADGANTSAYSSTWSFSVVDPVVMETPIPLEPAGAIATNRPTFRVRNGRVAGTTGAYYRFELATAPDVNAIIAVVTTTPSPSGETTVSIGDLPYGRNFYWRVHASDGTTMSNYSPLVVFTTPAAPAPPAPPPGTPPPGTPPSPSPAPPGVSPGGARTPDPPGSQLLPVPSYGASVVAEVARRYPSQLRNACKTNHDWLFLLLNELRKYDTRWGLNWKRGNVGDMSSDIVSYNPTNRPDEGNGQVYIFDVIGAECEANNPVFNDVTQATWAVRDNPACAAGTYCVRWTLQPYLRANFPAMLPRP